MRRDKVNTGNLNILIARLDANEAYAEDTLIRMSSESIFGEAVGKQLIKPIGKKDKWNHELYKLTNIGIEVKKGRSITTL